MAHAAPRRVSKFELLFREKLQVRNWKADNAIVIILEDCLHLNTVKPINEFMIVPTLTYCS